MSGPLLAIRAGQPTAEELAAVVTALTVALRSGSPRTAPTAPAWRRAARLEAVGAAPATCPADVTRLR